MKKLLVISTLLASLLTLAGCGGGGSSSSSSSSSSTTVSGTVSTGAVVSAGSVEIYDANGQLVGTTTTDANGQYTISGIDTSKYKLPFVIKAYGQVGDSNVTLHSITATGGTANVNQLTNAIATSLAPNGDPAGFTSGNALSSTTIGAAVSAYSDVISTLRSAFSTPADLISTQYTDNYDALLDNVSAQVLPNGKVILSTSQGKSAENQIGSVSNGTKETSNISAVELEPGQLPAASNNASMPAPSSVLTVKKLQALTDKLNACFAKPAASRVTQTTPFGGGSPNWVGLADECNDLATSDFKHDGVFWLDSTSGCAANGVRYCLGMFGTMLTNSFYNSAEFLPQTNIAAAGHNKWVVKFPIKYADGSIGQINDMTGGDDMVVTYSPSDGKYRLSGNQRDVAINLGSTVQYIKNIRTNAYRYETGLVLYVNGTSLRTLKKDDGVTVHVTKAKVTGKGLPATGVFLANKLNADPALYGNRLTINVGSGSLYNTCSGSLNLEFESVINSVGVYTSSTPNAASCSGMLRFAYADNPSGAYPVSSTSPSSLAAWVGSYMNDTQLNNIKVGEPYTFELTFSDGTVRTYIKRLIYPIMSLENTRRTNFPQIANTDFGAFDGTSSSYTITWERMKDSFVFNTSLYWSKASSTRAGFVTLGSNSSSIPCTSVDGSPPCRDHASWYSNGSNVPNSGIIQVRSRTLDGLQIMSQQRQY